MKKVLMQTKLSGPALRGEGQALPLRRLGFPSSNDLYHQYTT